MYTARMCRFHFVGNLLSAGGKTIFLVMKIVFHRGERNGLTCTDHSWL